MNDSTKISFVRHGEYFNPNEVFAGRLGGFGLSEEGRLQSMAAAKLLRGMEVAAVFSSPLLRTRQTAHFILQHYPELKLSLSKYLIEVKCPFDGRPLSEVRALNWDAYTGVGPPFEQPSDIIERVQTFVSKIRRQFPRKHVVAVTHGDIIAFFRLSIQHNHFTVENKLVDYPLPATIHSFTFHSKFPEQPPLYEYHKPYSD